MRSRGGIAPEPAGGGPNGALVLGAAPSGRRLRAVVLAIAAANAVLIAATWIFMRSYRSPGEWEAAPDHVKWVLAQLNLNRENVFATWFSSTLMLLVAVGALACFLADRAGALRPRDRRLSAGWLVLAAIFAVFSLDELGSLHENVGTLKDANPFGSDDLGWRRVLAPILVPIAALMAAFTLLHVRHRSPLAFGLLALGALLLFTVPLQESSHPEREEGTELFAMLSFLAATLAYLSSWGRTVLVPRRPALGAVLAAVALLAAGLWAFEHPLADVPGDKGIPRNWFLSTPAVLAAVLALVLAVRTPGGMRGPRGVYAGTAALAALLAAYYGSDLQSYLSIGDVGWSMRKLANGGAIVGMAALAVALSHRVGTWWGRGAPVAAAVLLAAALGNLANYGGALDFAAVSTLLCALVAHLPAGESSQRPRAAAVAGTAAEGREPVGAP